MWSWLEGRVYNAGHRLVLSHRTSSAISASSESKDGQTQAEAGGITVRPRFQATGATRESVSCPGRRVVIRLGSVLQLSPFLRGQAMCGVVGPLSAVMKRPSLIPYFLRSLSVVLFSKHLACRMGLL